LAQFGTVRNISEENDLITSKFGIIFKSVRYIDSDTELSSQGNIAMVLYKEMRIAEKV